MSDLTKLIEEYEELDGLDASDAELEAFEADFSILREDVGEVLSAHGCGVDGSTFEDYLDALGEALEDPELSDAISDLIETKWSKRGFLSKAFHRVFKTGTWKNEKTRRDTVTTNRQAKLAAAQARLRKHQARLASLGEPEADDFRKAATHSKLQGKMSAAEREASHARLAGKVKSQDLKNKLKDTIRAGKRFKKHSSMWTTKDDGTTSHAPPAPQPGQQAQPAEKPAEKPASEKPKKTRITVKEPVSAAS